MKSTLTRLALLLLCLSFSKICFAQLWWNQAARFAGNSGSYVASPNTAALNLTGSFTLECWVNPDTLGGFSKGIIAKGGAFGTALEYGLRLRFDGRFLLATRGVGRLTSRQPIPVNQWTHVAATYNAPINRFEFYINGVFDTSSTIANAAPPSNTDSLFIGISGATTPFKGLLDEVRIWNVARFSNQIREDFRTSLAVTSESRNYFGLVFCATFQNSSGRDLPIVGGSSFSRRNWATASDEFITRSIERQFITYPSNTFSYNESLDLTQEFIDGLLSYAAVPNSTAISPTTAITMEAWIYPRSYTNFPTIAGKNFQTGYWLGLTTTGGIRFYPRAGNAVDAPARAPLFQWTHVAATYDGTTTRIYVNGTLAITSTAVSGPVGVNTDSLYIGCDRFNGSRTYFFDGFIDELRIANYAKSEATIKSFLYKSIDASNDPSLTGVDVVYNMDGYTSPNAGGAERMILRGNAQFSTPTTRNAIPVSPLVRLGTSPSDYTMKYSGRRIPETGGIGSSRMDTIVISETGTLTDVNVFFAMNHERGRNCLAKLFAPNGDSVTLFGLPTPIPSSSGNIITIFDNDADSILNGLNPLTVFAPRIRPFGNITRFNGTNPQGAWRLRIDDFSGADTGRVIAWGLRVQTNPLSVEKSSAAPYRFALEQNYPNPFNPTTGIRYQVAGTSDVRLEVFDMLGRKVATLVNERKAAGAYSVTFNAANLSSGIYFYRLQAGAFTETRKMMLIK
jgi:hypothetical protein